MSVQAQVQGVGTLELPDGTDPAVIQQTVKKVIAQRQPGMRAADIDKDQWTDDSQLPDKPGTIRNVVGATGLDRVGEAADIGASVLSSAAASLAGGVVKAGAAANKALGIDTALGTDQFDFEHGTERLEEALTWKPKTDEGKRVMADVAKGLGAFEAWTDKMGQEATAGILKLGDKAAEAAKALGAPQSVVDFIDRHKEQVAAAYGSATKTTANAVPMLLGNEIKLPARKGLPGEPAPGEVPPPAQPLTLAPSTPRAAPTASPAATAPAAPAAAPPGTVPRGTPAPTPQAGGSSAMAATPRARAEAYARDRLGVGWDDLAAATQRKLELVAQKAGNLEKLNPEAVKRQNLLESLRVPITTTAGKLNRDNAELLREQGAAATPSGRSIVDTDIKANRDLRANIETLIDRLRGVGKTRATATSREQVGAAVAGREAGAPGALTLKQRQMQAQTRAAYKKARDTEPNATVSPDPMYEFIRGNPEVLNPQIQHLGWLQSWLKKAGIESADEVLEQVATPGEATPSAAARRGVKLSELDDLRKKAVSIAKGGGTDAHYAGEVIAAIDKSFEQIPDAAKAWKEARDKFRKERAEFENQGAIERLVGTKGGAYGTDPKTALEDVWKAGFKNAKLEEVRQLKRSLLSGSPEARLAGKKALRELRAATGQDLLAQITKGVSTNSRGETNITAESINNWIKGMGGGTLEGGVEKLNVLIGKRATNDLLKIREAAQITKTEPTVRNVGSNTFQKILNWMDDSGLGKLVKNVGGGPLTHLAESAAKSVQNANAVRAAGESATSRAERAARKAAERRAAKIQAQQRPQGPPQTYQGGP